MEYKFLVTIESNDFDIDAKLIEKAIQNSDEVICQVKDSPEITVELLGVK